MQAWIEQLRNAIVGLGAPRVLVWGDLMLDRYTFGTVERVSPEAPIPILRADRVDERLGGAAAVAGLAKALGADVRCFGVVGVDAEGDAIREQFKQSGIGATGVIETADRPTTLKQRFLSERHGHAQLLRVDHESTEPIGVTTEARLLTHGAAELAEAMALLVADYGKGVCSGSVVRQILELARSRNVPILVDPRRGADLGLYQGASLLIPNRSEAEHWVGRSIESVASAKQVAEELRLAAKGTSVLLKLDRDGVVLADGDAPAEHFPTRARAVFDVTGAGDAVLAGLGTALASGVPIRPATHLANLIGGMQVERIGVAPITSADVLREIESLDTPTAEPGGATPVATSKKWLSLDEAVAVVRQARQARRRIVFTNGCFAALHAGHLAYLAEARTLGDLLIVAINSTSSIRRIKGDRPIIPDGLRVAMLSALHFVDAVLVFDEDTPHHVIDAIHPDVLVKGGTTATIVGREIVEAYGGQVVRLGAISGISTTQLLSAEDRSSGSDSHLPRGD